MSYKQDLIKAARDRSIRFYVLPKIDGFSMSGPVTGRLMDVTLIGKAIFRPGSVPVQAIIETVAAAHSVAAKEICGNSRRQPFVDARMHAIYLIHAIWPQLSMPNIGRKIGGRNHSSIINAIERWPAYRVRLGREIAMVSARLGLGHDY